MKNAKKIILTIVFAKISIFLLIFLAFSLLPFGSNFYYPNFVYPPKSPITLETAYKTWDAQHYLFVSEKGYKKNADSNAFPPLYPFAIFLFSTITHNSFFSGIILSNIFSFFAFYLFYLLLAKQYTEKVACRSLLFLLAFPTSFYFSLIYTESLFFLLIMLFFTFLQNRKLLLASLMAFLLPLTRLIGTAIIIPFFFSYILEYHGHSVFDELIAIKSSLLQKKTILLIAPLLGLFVVMLIFYITTGNFFAQFDALKQYISGHSVVSFFQPLSAVKEFFYFPLSIHGYTNSILDRIFFLCFLLFLPFLFKRVSKVFFIYALCFGLLPVLSGSFMSYMRYLLIVFPIFITLGLMSLEKKYQDFTIPFLFLCTMLQALFIVMQGLNYWVS